MDRFLEIYNLSNLNQEEISNLDRLTTSTEIESVMKNFPRNKSPGPDSFTEQFYQTCKEELILILLNYSKEIGVDRTLPNSFYEVPITLTPQSDKGNYGPISMINTYVKIFNNILASWIQQYIDQVIHHDEVGFIPKMQGWCNIHKSTVWYTPLTNKG